MHRYIRGLMLAGAAGVLWGCGDDPLAEGAGDITKLVSTPAVLFVNQGSTEPTTIEAYDAGGSAREAQFELGNVGAGIGVVRDESYTPAYDKDGNLVPPSSPTRVRYQVTAGDGITESEFTVNAGGQSITIPVRVTPTSIAATFSTVTPGVGEVITATAPAGLLFTATTGVSFTGQPDAIVTDVAADGTTISFIAIPGTIGEPIFSNVALAYAPSIIYTLPSSTSLTAADPPAEVPAIYSDDTPAAGDAVTVTAANFQFTPTTRVVIGGLISANIAIAVDGSSLTFVPRPGATGIPTFEGIEIAGVSGLPLTLPGTSVVTAGTSVAAAVPGTDDPGTAPAVDLPTTTGLSAVFTDQSNFIDQFYNFNAVAAGTYQIDLWMDQGDGCVADLDLFTSSGNSATCNHPEAVSAAGIAAGALIETLVNVYGGPTPDWIQVIVTKTN
jgi:hypothetical protein